MLRLMKVIIFFCASVNFFPAWADTHTAATCSYANVSAAIAAASAGDTVTVPAGSCTWTSQLVITKGIQLIGAGIGNTIITSNWNNTGYTGLIQYAPANPAADDPFRLSGFTIDGAWKSGCVHLVNQNTTPVTKVRVDHNRLTRGYQLYHVVEGMVFGVADNNTIDWVRNLGSDCIDHFGLSPYGQGSWRYTTFVLGSSNNWYWEDNTVNWNNTVVDASGDIFDSAHGGRYAARFNAINDVSTNDTNLFPVFNNHGNQGSGEYSSMGAEIYGNVVNANWSQNNMVNHRGGQMIAFDNIGTGTAGWTSDTVREDANGCDFQCTYPVNQIDGTSQHPHDSYIWNNRKGTTRFGTVVDMTLDYNSSCGPGEPYRVVPQLDKDVWVYSTATGSPQTTGVRTGLLANRPANCTTGVGYWATDQGSWNQSTVGMKGYGFGNGVLYKCTATNTWTLYYTPYTYPHPLRNDLSVPGAPKNVRIN